MQLWSLLSLILGILGIFLSLWIIIPAPTWTLLPLGVGAPEISPWLIVVNAIALTLATLFYKGWWSNLIIVGSLVGIVIASLPLVQFSAVNRSFEAEMERVLGVDYLKDISHLQLRPKPLRIIDVFRGISIADVRINRGIVFASPDGVELKLNTYRPLAAGKYPTLVIIYGGAWRTGDPNSYEQFSSYMAARGYTVIAIDYRHTPQYKFPTQLEDVETALLYIKTHARDLEVDLTKMAVLGRSAGGHLASLAAYKQHPVIPFKAVISYYAPVNLANGYYDLPVPDPIDIQAVLNDFLGGSPEDEPKLYRQASLTTYVRERLPPSLLVYASRDHLVQAKFGRNLYDKLKATENPVIFLEIPWAEHAFDAVFFGVSNQLALYYTERFLASILNVVN